MKVHDKYCARLIKGRVPRDSRLPYVGNGPMVPNGDYITGIPLPYSKAVRQGGGWVSPDRRDGSFDLDVD